MAQQMDLEKQRDETEEPFLPSSEKPSSPPTSSQLPTFLNCFQWVVILVLALLYLHERVYQESQKWENGQIYSPAQHVIQRKDVLFTSGFEKGRTMYQGPPSPELDAAWEGLYQFGVSRIPREDAVQMVNKTMPIPNDPGFYITELSVFHQLHCLNQIRRRLYIPEADPELSNDPLLAMPHVEHCIDLMRQSLMCSADIAPISWTWSEKDQASEGIAAVLHTCRDWDSIVEWGREHHAKEFNSSVHVHSDLD